MTDITKIENPTKPTVVVSKINELIDNKQDTLVSGTNIKTVNNESILGEGNLEISVTSNYDNTTINENASDELQAIGVKEVRTDTAVRVWHGTQQQWNNGGAIKDTYYKWATTVGEDSTLPVSAEWHIAYGNDTFVAVSSSYNATSAYSSDGKNWTTVTHTGSYQAYGICYGDGVFVTNKTNIYHNTFSYSDDNGQTWKESNTVQDSIPSIMRSFTFGNGTFVITGYSQKVFYSSDKGINWSSSNLPSEGFWYTAYGNGRFVSIKNNSNAAAYSIDGGQTWTPMTLPVTDYWSGIAYGNGRFIAISQSSNKVLVLLDNTTTWNNYTFSSIYSTNQLYGICFDGEKFVATYLIGRILTTTDGEHWLEYPIFSSSAITVSYNGITYGNNSYVISSSNGTGCMFTFDYVYTKEAEPTTTSTLYSEPGIESTLTISQYIDGTIILSDSSRFNCNENLYLYYTVGESYPNYICHIDNVGLKIGDNNIANLSVEYSAGSNVTISDGVISATDTTYSTFTGADGTDAGSLGLVPAPASTDNIKYLKGNGTWSSLTFTYDSVTETLTIS